MTNYGYFPYHLYKPDYSKLSNILLRGDSKDYDWYGLRKSFSSSLQQSLFRESLLKLDYASLERRVAEHFAPKSIHVMSRPVEITDTETFTVTLDFSMPIHDEIVIELPPAPKPAKTFNFIVFDSLSCNCAPATH